MRKHIFLIVILVAFFWQCTEKTDPFLITKGQVGYLTKETGVEELDSIFANDSIYEDGGIKGFGYASTVRYLIYEKGGKHLMTISPSKPSDSIRTIENIQIYDERYKTGKGVNVNSTFKTIKDNHKISKIVNTMNNVLIFVNEIDAYFTIDKKELPADLRYNTSQKIEAVQIPDNAKIKYFMIGWE
ncbi:hypothetical protein [Leptobacterium sp. I13]|uniref:hypothetical protein n=1 Tax=Leptobacterium meishanense TaxID=3128904 RepID=UPI0030EF3E60